jgi:hypothetical protein
MVSLEQAELSPSATTWPAGQGSHVRAHHRKVFGGIFSAVQRVIRVSKHPTLGKGPSNVYTLAT